MAAPWQPRRSRPRRRSRPWLAAACLLAAVAAAVALDTGQADPAARLPRRYRLADLIESQQATTAVLRDRVQHLRQQVEAEQAVAAVLGPSTAELEAAKLVSGMAPLTGPGLEVTLDDSPLDAPPSGGSVNDLVVHSQDVQAVVNALWRAGAEAVSINGQRLVGTSAVLCVGNTLLLNGTVHSPPYVVTAIGASRDRFDGDRLVKRLRQHASTFGIRLSVQRGDDLTVPAYTGALKASFARPAA